MFDIVPIIFTGIDKNISPHTLRHYVECYIMVSEVIKVR